MPKIKYYYRIVRTIPKGSGWQTDEFDFPDMDKKPVEAFVRKDIKDNPNATYQLQEMIDYE